MRVIISRFRVAPTLFCTVLFCTLIFISVPVTAVNSPSSPMPVTDMAALNKVAVAAEGHFTPINGDKICQAKAALQTAAASLDEQFQKVGPQGKGWEKYLDWSDLKSTIYSDKPDMEKLEKGYKALASTHRGLELACFIDLRLAIEKYLNLRHATDSPEIKAAYDKLMADMPKMLEEYATNPTSNPSAPLQQVVTWLDKFDQAPELLAKLRKEFAKPNFYASASKRLISPGFDDEINEPVDIYDTILKTRVHSQGTMLGQTTLQLVPSDPCVSPGSALLEVQLAGTSNTTNKGHRGPVWIYSDSTSQIMATKLITINADGLCTMPADAQVNNSTHIRSICTQNHCQLIENIAWKQARQSQCKAEAIASQHAEQRVCCQVNEKADSKVAQANLDYQKQFKLPLLHRKLFPEQLDFSTTEDRLNIVALQHGLAEFAAWSDPPAVDETQFDASVRIHESVINNSTWTFLAGRTFAEAEFLDLVADLSGGEVPEQFQPDEDKEPWAVTFAKENPIRVTFHDNQIRIEIHATSFTKGDTEYTAMNIAATYKIEAKDGKFTLVRVGDLEVFPPGFESEQRKLSVREQTLRKLLQKRFSKIFETKWTARDAVPLPERWQSAGSLQINRWDAQDGWMTLTWKLEK